MKRIRLLMIALVLGVTACATETKDPTAGMTAQQIYDEARDFMSAVQYDKAIEYFDKVEGLAAGTILGEQAQLDKAFAYHRNGDHVLAIATVDRFMRLHPNHPATDYALYLKAMASYKVQDTLLERWFPQELAERDTAAARAAFANFKELVQRFPESKYSEDAKKRMRYIAHSLVTSDLKVAEFYFSRGAYVASINRAQDILKDYPNTDAVEKALELLVRNYDKLGLKQLRDDNLRVLKRSFPDNVLSKSVFLDTPGATKPPTAIKAPPPPAEPAKKPWYRFW